MADQPSLMPANGTALLRAYEQATAYEPSLIPGIDIIPDIKGRELPAWVKFLLYEYGLIELTPYVPNDYTLLADGRLWQIERDTFAAITRALNWVSAPGSVVEAPTRRTWWNSFQLYLDSLPPADIPNLERIDRVTQLSKPFRSDFRRGVYGYDVPALEGDTTRLEGSLLDVESGVRLRANGPLWSFGRVAGYEHTLTEVEGTALGNWIDEISDFAYLVDFIEGEAIVASETVPIEDTTDFARAGSKLAQGLSGDWIEFGVDEIAITDRGLLLEPEATRRTIFALDENPLDDELAAEVLATGLADPFGGTDATRYRFSDDGWLLLIPAEGLLPSTVYGVSFFAKLVASSGTVGAGGFYDQLVEDEWVRVEGSYSTPAALDGQWLDLSLLAPGAVVDIELHGFQVEAVRVTSPIVGDDINGTRAADELTLNLPEENFSLSVLYEDLSGSPILGVEGDTLIDPATLDAGKYVLFIGNLRSGTWGSMTFPWELAEFPWNAVNTAERAAELAAWFEDGHDVHFRLKAAGGAVIGYRRARVVRQVKVDFQGEFVFDPGRYSAAEDGVSVFIEAMTDAGNGAGQTVASVDLVIDGTPAGGAPVGRLWLPPGGLTGGTVIAPKTLSIPLRATVRERIKLLLRF